MVQLARHSFSVDEYNRMGEARILPGGVRTELIEGEIIEMVPIGSHHAGAVIRLNTLLSESLSRRQSILAVQSPLVLSDRSQTEPDICLLRPRADFYTESHPTPQDVLLLIEFADSSASLDRTVKLPLYAREAFVEVWIVDLTADAIEVYREPSEAGYSDRYVAKRGNNVSPARFPDIIIDVNDILG
jgi:Uma2 family endonuclease